MWYSTENLKQHNVFSGNVCVHDEKDIGFNSLLFYDVFM